ncbi:DUF6705 family protein, partial [Flavobacterium sp. U410]
MYKIFRVTKKYRMMKKTAYILTLLLTSLTFGQSPIIDLLDDDGNKIANAYYKDTNNLLDAFEGTFVYTNGSTQLKIELVKKIQQFNGRYYEDLIIGEYQYIENGTEIVNTLDEIDLAYINQHQHNIFGNILVDKNYRRWICSTCGSNENRLVISIMDNISDRFGYLILRKITSLDSSGQTVVILQAKITNVSQSFS